MKGVGFWREMLSIMSEENITMPAATPSRYVFPK